MYTRDSRESGAARSRRKHPELAKLGNKLIANQRTLDLYTYLYPHKAGGKARTLSVKEWERRALAAWYAILKYGVKHGDVLEYC
jgi:hypothetical protein